MASNLVHSALATHTQVFPVLIARRSTASGRSHLCDMQRWVKASVALVILSCIRLGTWKWHSLLHLEECA